MWHTGDDQTRVCYTVGHSNHSAVRFAELLEANGITVAVDVRSVPYSRRHQQFNREPLRDFLREREIGYEFLGHSLGARGWGEQYMASGGKVDFDKVRKSPRFLLGVAMVIEMMEAGQRIALVCAEADPFDCHRFVLVSCQLARQCVDVRHILSGGDELTNEVLERRLLEEYQPELFSAPPSDEEVLELAYAHRGFLI